MKFAELFATAPLGALIAFSDGTPQPPARFNKKLSKWRNSNGIGRLMAKNASEGKHDWDRDTIALRISESPIIVLTVHFSAASNLDYEVTERLQPGQAVILNTFGGKAEVEKVFPDRASADAKLANGYQYGSYAVADIGPDGAPILA